jgi:hypothetical protein
MFKNELGQLENFYRGTAHPNETFYVALNCKLNPNVAETKLSLETLNYMHNKVTVQSHLNMQKLLGETSFP